MPVLLTVGKMEPFKAEDGNRVRADGVIIKPFEATDLVAAVQKISAKVEAPPPAPEPPAYERTVKMAPLEEDTSYAEWHSTAEHHVEAEEAAAKEKEKIAIPDDIGGGAAIGMDLLEPVAPAETPAPMAMAAAAEIPAEPSFEEPPAPEAAAIEPEMAAPAEEAPVHFELETFGGEAIEASAPPPAELEHTAAPDVGEVTPPRPDGFETTAAAPEPRHVAEIEPLLVTDGTEMASAFPTKFGVEGAEPVPVGIASEVPGLYDDEHVAAPAAEEAAPETPAELAVEAPAPPAEDFEAMVAARLASESAVVEEPAPAHEPQPTWKAHEEQLEHHEAGVSLEAEMNNASAAAAPAPIEMEMAPPAPAHDDSLAEEIQRAFADLPAEPAPAEEAAPAVAPEHELAAAMAAAAGASASAAVADAVGAGTQKLDTAQMAHLAEIVHRVTERLKTEILAEIAKEFENNK